MIPELCASPRCPARRWLCTWACWTPGWWWPGFWPWGGCWFWWPPHWRSSSAASAQFRAATSRLQTWWWWWWDYSVYLSLQIKLPRQVRWSEMFKFYKQTENSQTGLIPITPVSIVRRLSCFQVVNFLVTCIAARDTATHDIELLFTARRNVV